MGNKSKSTEIPMIATKRREMKKVIDKTTFRLVGIIGDISKKVKTALRKRMKDDSNIPIFPMVVASSIVSKGVRRGDKDTAERVVAILLIRIALPIRSTFNEPVCR